MTWDAGGSNSYRMSAEGKFDLALAPDRGNQPTERVEQGAVGETRFKVNRFCVKTKVNAFFDILCVVGKCLFRWCCQCTKSRSCCKLR